MKLLSYLTDSIILQFFSGATDLRLCLIHRVRNQCALGVFGPEIANELTSREKRISSTILKEKLGFSIEKSRTGGDIKKYQVMYPLLYEEGEGTRPSRMFANTVPIRVSSP